MDPITQQATIAAAGAGGGGPVYVDDVFSTYLYNGNSSTQTITNGIDLSGEGGAVILKKRSTGAGTVWTDTARGANKHLRSDLAGTEYTETNILTAFNSNGFSIGNEGDVNASGQTYASWSFRKAPGFFDVVTYTGNGTAGRTVAHNLGSVPGMIIVRRLSPGDDWFVYHRSAGATKYFKFNMTTSATTSSNFWNDTEPTASVFTVGSDGGVNLNNYSYVAYIFAHDDQSFGTDSDESIIKCGTFSTDGSQNATVTGLGWEPQWVLFKRTSTTGDWRLHDSMRNLAHSGYALLKPNTTDAEASHATVTVISATPDGFEIQNTNASSDYIYMAIRRPHKQPEAATEVFAIDTGNGSSTIPVFDSGFPVDFTLLRNPSATADIQSFTRMTGTYHLVTNDTDAQSNAGTLYTFDSNVGWAKNQFTSAYYSWMFKRAAGFFDVVAYTGTGSATTVNHNLTVAPEFVITKMRTDAGYDWMCWHSGLSTNNTYIQLNQNAAANSNSNPWNNTAPTSTQFSLGNWESNTSSKDYIALLFATLPGISKVGSYTGTGNAINVDCGFTNGARFVLIKRTDSSSNSHWTVYDSTRGIVSGNDPYIRLNTTQAQTTDEDHVDPLNAGFTVTTHNDVNISGGNYIFLAIA